MKLILEQHGYRYIVEHNADDFNSNELKSLFSRMMVMAGYPPSVIEDEYECGEYQFVGDGEVIISKEKLEELKGGTKCPE